MTDWIRDPVAWNKVRLGGILLPGIAAVTSSRGREIDFQKAPGKDGGFSVDKGENAGKVKIRLTLKASEWDEWKKTLPAIEPIGGKPRGPLDIQHPDPNSRGIARVQVKDIATSPPTARGGYVIDIDCQQFTPKPKETKKVALPPRAEPTAYTSFLHTGSGTSLGQQGDGQAADANNILSNTFPPGVRVGTTIIEN